MKRQNTESLGAVIMQLLREQGLEKPLLEHRVIEAWPRLLGTTVAHYTGKMEVKDGVLYVRIQSAALRHELFLCRLKLVEKLNAEVGADVLSDIRLL